MKQKITKGTLSFSTSPFLFKINFERKIHIEKPIAYKTYIRIKPIIGYFYILKVY